MNKFGNRSAVVFPVYCHCTFCETVLVMHDLHLTTCRS